ncbi:MAG TPA: CerR family C-terminal domain-containing protein [Planctomicrobium sp.]|nr:CerR family C-terminal domain-containing protein [Planctomicrobium sp.]
MSQPRDDGTRDRILNAAGAVFADHGFEKATIREIVTRAEVNLAAVNYHFGDKERLYRATIRYAHELASGEVPFPEWHPESTPPEIRLREFIHITMQRMMVIQRLPWHSRLMMRETMMRETTVPTEACREMAEEYIRPHFQVLQEILSEMLPPDTPPQRLYQLAFSVIGQCLFYKVSCPVVEILVPPGELKEHYTPPKLADHIADVMLAALGRQDLIAASEEAQT